MGCRWNWFLGLSYNLLGQLNSSRELRKRFDAGICRDHVNWDGNIGIATIDVPALEETELDAQRKGGGVDP